jgi:hypothetical protein
VAAPGWLAHAPASFVVPSAGSYTLYPWAKDAAGNVSKVFPSPVTVIVTAVDNEIPTVTWVSPVSDGSGYFPPAGVVHLQVSASDNVSVAKIHFFRWDPVLKVHINLMDLFTPPYGWDFGTQTLHSGWNEIDVQAYDQVGNVSAQQHIFLFHDAILYLPIIWFH